MAFLNAGTHIRSPLAYGDMQCATSAERYAADAVFTEIDTHALAQADALYELGTLWNSPLTTISPCRLYGGGEKQTESRKTS